MAQSTQDPTTTRRRRVARQFTRNHATLDGLRAPIENGTTAELEDALEGALPAMEGIMLNVRAARELAAEVAA